MYLFIDFFVLHHGGKKTGKRTVMSLFSGCVSSVVCKLHSLERYPERLAARCGIINISPHG